MGKYISALYIWRRSCVVMTRRSLAGGLSLPRRPVYGWQVTTLWVNCPLWVSQTSLAFSTHSSIPRGRQLSSLQCVYIKYMHCRGGDHLNGRLGPHTAVWQHRSKCGLGLLPP